VTRVVAEVTLRRGLRERRRQGEGSQELVSAAGVGLDGPEDLCTTRPRVLESYSAMKVARWVREGAVEKGLPSGSTSLAAYFIVVGVTSHQGGRAGKRCARKRARIVWEGGNGKGLESTSPVPYFIRWGGVGVLVQPRPGLLPDKGHRGTART
jgi:hypothetical protein